MSARGTTGPGRSTPLPAGGYEPAESVKSDKGSLTVEFFGEDGRKDQFRLGDLPLHGWHASLAEAWAERTGPSGSLRTRLSARNAWGHLTRMIRYFSTLPLPPVTPDELRTEHVDSYRRFRVATRDEGQVLSELRTNALTFDLSPLKEMITEDVRDRMRPHTHNRPQPVSGYSDGELKRLVDTARSDVSALRTRLMETEPPSTEAQRRFLTRVERSGHVPVGKEKIHGLESTRRAIAGKFFVTKSDVISMLVLMVAVSGLNVETIKELPVQHRVLEGRAVELSIIKRRRGPGRWHSTVTWEIGPPGKELHTAGGLYLLFHRLMAPARELLKEPAFWAVWMHPGRAGGVSACRSIFGEAIGGDLQPLVWSRLHALPNDSFFSESEFKETSQDLADEQLLRLNFNRLKTSIDVRRTRRMGGHLPSAARTNTVPVLFRNYLAGDQTTLDWAREVLTETLVDVEQTAWSAHLEALAKSGTSTLAVVRTGETDHPSGRQAPNHLDNSEGAGDDAAWNNCVDHEHHPVTGRRCAASFLDCFQCGNCLITDSHLPRLLGLLDALELRRSQVREDIWWSKYGKAWIAIRYDVLTKFSESEVAEAQSKKPADSLLDLVEPRWERP